MAATVLGTHGSGNHAGRPAGNAVPDGSLYSCTTHSLIYVSSYGGNSWATWASLTGTGFADPMTTRGDVIIRDASNATARLGKGAAKTVLASDGTDVAYATLATLVAEAENYLSGDVTITTANTFYDGPTLTLSGTFLLIGSVHVQGRAGGADAITAKLWNGTTVKSSAQANVSTGGYPVQLPLMGYVVTSGSETWKISCTTNNGGAAIKAAALNNGVGNNASYLIAIKLA